MSDCRVPLWLCLKSVSYFNKAVSGDRENHLKMRKTRHDVRRATDRRDQSIKVQASSARADPRFPRTPPRVTLDRLYSNISIAHPPAYYTLRSRRYALVPTPRGRCEPGLVSGVSPRRVPFGFGFCFCVARFHRANRV